MSVTVEITVHAGNRISYTYYLGGDPKYEGLTFTEADLERAAKNMAEGLVENKRSGERAVSRRDFADAEYEKAARDHEESARMIAANDLPKSEATVAEAERNAQQAEDTEDVRVGPQTEYAKEDNDDFKRAEAVDNKDDEPTAVQDLPEIEPIHEAEEERMEEAREAQEEAEKDAKRDDSDRKAPADKTVEDIDADRKAQAEQTIKSDTAAKPESQSADVKKSAPGDKASPKASKKAAKDDSVTGTFKVDKKDK